MHRIRALLVCTCTMLTCLADPASGAPATPRLELDARWYMIVDPYRYVEARRYERGWNRGADAAVVGGLVRAPVDGTVRFAGDVAGRTVVTLQTQVDGLPVVVTFSGSWSSAVAPGDRIERGQSIGTGSGVHVGMYDQARRSRYLPVASSGGAAPAPQPPGSIDRSTVSGSLAGRLQDAILGRVESAQAEGGGSARSGGSTLLLDAGGAAGGGAHRPMPTASPAPYGSEPWPGDSSMHRLAPLLTTVGTANVPRMGGAVGLRDTLPRPVSPSPAGGYDVTWFASSALRSAVVDDGRRAARVGPLGSPSADAANDASASGNPHVGTTPGGPRRRSSGRPANGRSSDEVFATSSDDVDTDLEESVTVERRAPGAGLSSSRRKPWHASAGRRLERRWGWPTGIVALAALVALAGLTGRRRRGRRRGALTAQTSVQAPLDPVIPLVSRPRVHAVHTDGSAIVPRADPVIDTRALAWADPEPGTSGSTDTRSSAAPRQRAPEHA